MSKPLVEKGNNCFIDPESLKPADQWAFLKTIERVPTAKLDKLYEALSKSREREGNKAEILNITLNNAVRLNRSGLNANLVAFLKEELNFANAEFFVKNQVITDLENHHYQQVRVGWHNNEHIHYTVKY